MNNGGKGTTQVLDIVKNWGVSREDFVIQAGLETSPEFGNS